MCEADEHNMLHATKNLNKVPRKSAQKGTAFIGRNAVKDVGSIASSHIYIWIYIAIVW